MDDRGYPPIFDAGMGPARSIKKCLIDQVLQAPWLTVIVALIPVLIFTAGLTKLSRDPSVDAFVSHDHPAYVARERAKEIFGLEDPVVVVFAQDHSTSAFNTPTLEALAAFTDKVSEIPGVESGVISLASEKAILADSFGNLETPRIVEQGSIDPDRARRLYAAMPQMENLLVSADGDALAAIIPVEDPNHAQDQVAAIEKLAISLAPPGVSVHMAGVATMNSRLAEHIATDTRIFLPAAFLTIGIVLLIALRRVPAIVGPFVVVICAALSAIGAIGLFGSKYFLITTALPVVVVAIAVADSIHLTLAYQKQRTQSPARSRDLCMSDALDGVAMPILLTSVTTSVGFLGLALGSPMRPIADFGIFAAVGTMVACLLSLTILPLIQMRLSDTASAPKTARKLDDALTRLAVWSASRPHLALGLSALVIVGAIAGAVSVSFDYERRNYFSEGDPVLVADELLAERFAGGNILDVVVDGREDEALLTASSTRAVQQLENRLLTLPGIVKTTSYADSISLMHERLNDAARNSLPVLENAPAQYMFLYEASGDPEDFDAQLDFGRREALVRSYLASGQYSTAKPVIEQAQTIVADWSAQTGLKAEISGRIPVNDGWMDQLKTSHPGTIALAVLMVFLTTWVFLKDLRWTVVAVLPVLSGIVLLYAAMGITGIDLAPATSMCAAIAAGLGVDFGIHLVQELRAQLARGRDLIAALGGHYVVVMRACFFSAASLGAGFMVVALSQTPVLRWFGILIAFAAFGSLFGALVIVPAVARLASRKSRYHPSKLRSSIHA